MRLIVATVGFAWLPTVLFSALAWPRTHTIDPILLHAEIHARLLCALGLVLLADAILEIRVDLALRSVLDDGILREVKRETWTGRRRLARATRWFDLCWLATIYTVLALTHFGVLPSWMVRWLASTMHGAVLPWAEASIAWWWYVLVAQPLLLLALGRWLFRWLLWGLLLWRLARLGPVVQAAHVDHAGGLGFLRLPLDACRVYILALGVAIAAVWFDEIGAGQAQPSTFSSDLIVFLVLVVAMMYLPYLALTPVLVRARHAGIIEYSTLMRRYLTRFEARWLNEQGQSREDLLGHPDLSGLADLGGGAAVVGQMRSTIPDRGELKSLLIVAALPFLVVALAYGPSTAELLRGMIKRVVGG